VDTNERLIRGASARQFVRSVNILLKFERLVYELAKCARLRN